VIAFPGLAISPLGGPATLEAGSCTNSTAAMQALIGTRCGSGCKCVRARARAHDHVRQGRSGSYMPHSLFEDGSTTIIRCEGPPRPVFSGANGLRLGVLHARRSAAVGPLHVIKAVPLAGTILKLMCGPALVQAAVAIVALLHSDAYSMVRCLVYLGLYICLVYRTLYTDDALLL
jgi:hypothetical protein